MTRIVPNKTEENIGNNKWRIIVRIIDVSTISSTGAIQCDDNVVDDDDDDDDVDDNKNGDIEINNDNNNTQ